MVNCFYFQCMCLMERLLIVITSDGVIGLLDKKDFRYFGFLKVTLSSGVDYADISRLIGNFYHAQKHFYNIIS